LGCPWQQRASIASHSPQQQPCASSAPVTIHGRLSPACLGRTYRMSYCRRDPEGKYRDKKRGGTLNFAGIRVSHCNRGDRKKLSWTSTLSVLYQIDLLNEPKTWPPSRNESSRRRPKHVGRYIYPPCPPEASDSAAPDLSPIWQKNPSGVSSLGRNFKASLCVQGSELFHCSAAKPSWNCSILQAAPSWNCSIL
jgi:hypothetical protein